MGTRLCPLSNIETTHPDRSLILGMRAICSPRRTAECKTVVLHESVTVAQWSLHVWNGRAAGSHAPCVQLIGGGGPAGSALQLRHSLTARPPRSSASAYLPGGPCSILLWSGPGIRFYFNQQTYFFFVVTESHNLGKNSFFVSLNV